MANDVEVKIIWLDEEMVELPLLLPGCQATEMERLAYFRGLTLEQLIRLLMRDYLTDRADIPETTIDR